MSSVLVVEDSDDARDMLCDFLQIQGFEVAAAANGRDALEYLRSAESLPSMILLDLSMPVLDGFGFRDEQLAASPAIANIPVVVMTAERAPDRARLHVQEVIPKPLSLAQLLDAVHRTTAAA